MILKYLFIFLLGLSILVRLIFIPYQSYDYTCCFLPWFEFIKTHGGLFSLKYEISNYNPSYLYLLSILSYFPVSSDLAIKFFPIIFDYFCAFIVYLLVKLKYGSSSKLPVTALLITLFFPTVIINSAIWGQFDSIYTVCLLLSVYFLIRKKYIEALIAFSAGFSIKPQGIFLLPLFLILLMRKDIPILSFLTSVIGTYVALLVPSVLVGRNLNELLTIYLHQSNDDGQLVLNAPTIFQFISNNYYPIFQGFFPAYVILFISLFLYIISKNKFRNQKDIIIHLAFISVFIIPLLLPKIHERYFYPADIFSIVYAFHFPKYFVVPFLIGTISTYTYLLYLSPTYQLVSLSIFSFIYLLIGGVILYGLHKPSMSNS